MGLRIRHLSSLALTGLLCLPAGGCRRQPEPAPSPELLARVGSREVRAADLREAMLREGKGHTPEEKTALMEGLVERAALVQRALEAGLDKDPAVQRAWENLLIGRLREVRMAGTNAAKVPAADAVEAAYTATPEAWVEPAARRGCVLFIETPPRTSEARRAELLGRARQALEKAAAQPREDAAVRGFGAVSVEFSDDQATRYQGGQTGWLHSDKPDGRFDPAVTRTLFSLGQPGDLSSVIETARGYYIVRLDEVRASRTKPLSEVRPALAQKLQAQAARDAEGTWKKAATDGVKTEWFPGAIEAVTPPAPPPAAAGEGPPGIP